MPLSEAHLKDADMSRKYDGDIDITRLWQVKYTVEIVVVFRVCGDQKVF